MLLQPPSDFVTYRLVSLECQTACFLAFADRFGVVVRISRHRAQVVASKRCLGNSKCSGDPLLDQHLAHLARGASRITPVTSPAVQFVSPCETTVAIYIERFKRLVFGLHVLAALYG